MNNATFTNKIKCSARDIAEIAHNHRKRPSPTKTR
jgi:hypothetical protein